MPDTLVLGLGGAGARVCRRLAERLVGELQPGQTESALPEVLALETDRSAAEVVPGRTLLLTASAAVLDVACRHPERFRADWLDREVLRGRGPVDRGTGGCRMLGRFLLLLPDNLTAVREALRRWLGSGVAARAAEAPQPPRVYVVASAAGGTGGGQVTDVGYLLQDVAAEAGIALDPRAILFVPPPGHAGAGNALATLTELHYFADPNTRYTAWLRPGEEAAPFETRRPPFRRVSLLTSLTADGAPVPLARLQERAVIYLLTACAADRGAWRAEQREREAQVRPVDGDGNPQLFSTFGVEWVEYPEERLVNAVYRNLVRRSLATWLQGDHPYQLSEIPGVPLKDPEALSELLAGFDAATREEILRPVVTRTPWIHRAPPNQWKAMDQELEAQVQAAAGTLPAPGRPGKGPIAERARALREQALNELRRQAREALSRDDVSLERVARILNELAAELRTLTDPVQAWESERDACTLAKQIVLWAVTAVRRDPFFLFQRRPALRKLASEYERIAAQYAASFLTARTAPFLRELRGQVLEPVRAWAGRISELVALVALLGRAWADYESAVLEQLRKEDEEHRLALGMLRLPGAETPYISNASWNLPYCRPEEEAAAIRDLRRGWIQFLVERDDALLALPGRSVLDGAGTETREERLPWLMPSAYAPVRESASPAMRQAVYHIDRELRNRLEDRLRTWLSATAFQRLAEQHRNPVELEFHLRRLVNGAGDLPALEPPHARPSDLSPEYELIFFGDAKPGEEPSVLKLVADGAARERPTRIVPSRCPHYLTALAEHPGFALSRCPAYHQIEEAVRRAAQEPAPIPFSRIDVPWRSATLVTAARLRDASDALYLALAWGILRPLPDGTIPIPASLLSGVGRAEGGLPRFPLPGEFDLAVRQLAGDAEALEAVGLAVDRMFQSRGVEWCGLQLEQAVRDGLPAEVRFPGASAPDRLRAARLAALRAAARYEELFDEYARTPTGQETAWLRVATPDGAPIFQCPACAASLGAEESALPASCPACREPLLPHRLQGVARADRFRRIPNPFVVGTPLETRSQVFVGREDIIQAVRERLIRPASRTILILIGERRCGKTSALKQLQYRLEGDLTPLFIDMQGLTATDLPGFLYWLSWRMKEALEERGIRVDLPSFEEFTSGPPDYQFETVVLPEIRRKLNGGRVLLMMDEFEVLAQRVMKGSFDPRAFDYLRHLMQHGEGIEFLFAGTHILRQFAANYVTFLFNIGVFLNVDFLRPEDALRLIQEPVAAAGVTYDREALDAVLELAGAHAYFTQMFGFHLVERLNRLRKRHVTRQDVEEVSGPVIEAAGAHLDHVWSQLGNAERLLISFFVEFCPRGQRCREDDLLAAAVQADPKLRPFVFRSAVEKLAAVGLLRLTTQEEDGRPIRMLGMTAEVYRRWLQTQHPYSRLREEGVTWE